MAAGCKQLFLEICLFSFCVYLFVCIILWVFCLHAPVCLVPGRPEEGNGSPGAGVRSGCWDWTRVLCKSSQCSKLPSPLSSLQTEMSTAVNSQWQPFLHLFTLPGCTQLTQSVLLTRVMLQIILEYCWDLCTKLLSFQEVSLLTSSQLPRKYPCPLLLVWLLS